MLSKPELSEVPDIAVASEAGIFSHFIHEAPIVAKEIIIALLPIIVIYTICNMIFFHNSKRANARVATGCVLTFVGLVIFLVGVNSGFMDVGRYIGRVLATEHSKAFIVAIAFLMGVLTILAEPAVHVLTKQIEAEKEIVLIISEEAKTKDIVESIRKETQIEEEGKGIIFVTNVAATYGLAK